MIQAFIFDLDGTLLQTERLKALSYARAAVQLCPYSLQEDAVIDGFKDVVGLSRQEVAQRLIDRYDLAPAATALMAQFGVSTPWQAFIQLRLQLYAAMIADPQVILNSQWAHNVELLQMARRQGYRVGLATMSHCEQVTRILDILGWQTHFDFIATRDDVEHGKPDPEIYHLVASMLNVDADQCLVIEDSPTGVTAALRAGMRVVAVSTPFTQAALRTVDGLAPDWIVDDPATLMPTVQAALAAS